jgi:glycosyltransferase involved in cell wall biosynthesis
MKNIFYKLPKILRRSIVWLIEFFALMAVYAKDGRVAPTKHQKSGKTNVLIYHIDALSFGGTEKNLQMIAKYLDKATYNVFLLHGTKTEKNRAAYLDGAGVEILNFSHENTGRAWPYYFTSMNPALEQIVQDKNIDCIITATPGQTIYPFIKIRNIPIILINIFGSFSMQKNIVMNLCVSNAVQSLAERVVNKKKLMVQYNPSEKPLWNKEEAKTIRESFGIADSDLVFGRIGRADNSIFDPIGLLGFEAAVRIHPDIHYIIMSPAEAAKKLVEDRSIPNVHFLAPSYLEEDVWAFHQAIDVLAHFRKDGESCGLNIIESMLVGNPILTHKSSIWNAHLEYLDDSFSRYAEIDDYNQYGENIAQFRTLHETGELKIMGERAKEKAEKLFLIENTINLYQNIIDEAVK